ncbi:hypothetical protein FKM82_020747 [Ascaphus truei]
MIESSVDGERTRGLENGEWKKGGPETREKRKDGTEMRRGGSEEGERRDEPEEAQIKRDDLEEGERKEGSEEAERKRDGSEDAEMAGPGIWRDAQGMAVREALVDTASPAAMHKERERQQGIPIPPEATKMETESSKCTNNPETSATETGSRGRDPSGSDTTETGSRGRNTSGNDTTEMRKRVRDGDQAPVEGRESLATVCEGDAETSTTGTPQRDDKKELQEAESTYTEVVEERAQHVQGTEGEAEMEAKRSNGNEKPRGQQTAECRDEESTQGGILKMPTQGSTEPEKRDAGNLTTEAAQPESQDNAMRQVPGGEATGGDRCLGTEEPSMCDTDKRRPRGEAEAAPSGRLHVAEDLEEILEQILQEIRAQVCEKDVQIQPLLGDFSSFTEFQTDPGRFGHVIEIYDFSDQVLTEDLMEPFCEYRDKGFNLQWVDDAHALGIFSSPEDAYSASCRKHPGMKFRPLSQGSRQSKLRAQEQAEISQPSKDRLEIDASVAKRLVSRALGLPKQEDISTEN